MAVLKLHRVLLCFGVELVLQAAPAESYFLNTLFKTKPVQLFLKNTDFLQLLMMGLPRHKEFFFRLRKSVWTGSKHRVLELGCRTWATLVSLIPLSSV